MVIFETVEIVREKYMAYYGKPYYKEEFIMTFERTRILTSEERDYLWKNAFAAVPDMLAALERRNALTCAKELLALGAVDEESYEKLLFEILNKSGYEFVE